jgi:hypothetical protein
MVLGAPGHQQYCNIDGDQQPNRTQRLIAVPDRLIQQPVADHPWMGERAVAAQIASACDSHLPRLALLTSLAVHPRQLLVGLRGEPRR